MDREKLTSLRAADRRHHIHPFTDHVAMHEKGTYIVESASGCHVQDESGRKLLDGLAGLWCVNVGYGREEMVESIAKQLRQLPYYTSFFQTTTEPAIRLAETLANLAPSRLNHTMFCNSGTEANESALKAIRAYNVLKGRPQKQKLMTRTYSYHGVGLASSSLTVLETCNKPFDLPLAGFVRVPGPHAYAANMDHDPEGYARQCLQQTAEAIAKEGAHTIAAMFVEPVQGAGGVIPAPVWYLQELRQLCRDNDILFVADEVITGFGRLGDWFASNMWNLDPDMLCMAKGITSGYIPLGATMIYDEMADTLSRGGYFAHGFTYSGHPVACAAALTNIEIIRRERLCERVREDIGPYFQDRLRTLTSHPAVAQVRGAGLMAAVELVPAGGRTALRPDLKLGPRFAELARDRGLIVRGILNSFALAPALIISKQEIDFMVETLRTSLDQLWK